MSLVAIVYCRCVEQGKASAPPFSTKLLVSDEEGRLTLTLTEGHEKQLLKEQKHQWEKDCCSHPWRHYLNEWIGDWPGVQMLYSALHELGTHNFPTLLECIPLANTGTVSPEQSKKALQELEVFQESLCRGEFRLVSLVSNDDRELCSIAYSQGRCIYFTDKHEFWLDGNGLKILSRSNEEPVFESKHFSQEYLDDKAQTLFVDKTSGAKYLGAGDIRIQDATNPEIPAEFKVEERLCSSDGFDYIVIPLKKAFQASVEISRSLIWG